ncbi:MAG: hypothetical protein LBH55_00400 [Mycoplasmataceae bacterium]|jgi:hypothetical protein|nr:hypothetical protein [Mycoplasmataceae bacterium]
MFYKKILFFSGLAILALAAVLFFVPINNKISCTAYFNDGNSTITSKKNLVNFTNSDFDYKIQNLKSGKIHLSDLKEENNGNYIYSVNKIDDNGMFGIFPINIDFGKTTLFNYLFF